MDFIICKNGDRNPKKWKRVVSHALNAVQVVDHLSAVIESAGAGRGGRPASPWAWPAHEEAQHRGLERVAQRIGLSRKEAACPRGPLHSMKRGRALSRTQGKSISSCELRVADWQRQCGAEASSSA